MYIEVTLLKEIKLFTRVFEQSIIHYIERPPLVLIAYLRLLFMRQNINFKLHPPTSSLL